MVVIYHETMGTPTDYGYGYKVVEPEEVKAYVKQGWYEKSIDVPTNIHRVAAEKEENQFAPEPEPELKDGVEGDQEPDKQTAPMAKKKGRPSKK